MTRTRRSVLARSISRRTASTRIAAAQIAVNLDRDGDGFLRPSDCNDADPRVHPGVVDIPGNTVDEDCGGGPAPFPVLDSTIGVTFTFSRSFTVFDTLTIRRVKAGLDTLRMACSGRGCPFRTRTRKLTRNQRTLTLTRPLRRARLRPGARLEVRVTQPGTIGVVARYTVRAGKTAGPHRPLLRSGRHAPLALPHVMHGRQLE